MTSCVHETQLFTAEIIWFCPQVPIAVYVSDMT
ncbi:hypothetical protein CCUG63695_00143 [Mycobacteroides franklinii]|uniref:Uncharacterized protein n=1 Tax=Mycobacteroides franklinii TaxID=948102 RepID=A0A4R8QYH6_9MYCO|nr:hypothetical protein CCUG64054_00777 [Mycobacteroides franklinii]TDZ48624.1 hypothetical protein CCUG63697_03153 [Mycobacteroides franklinii]TDZ58805.1 hypothetical protein CCUG63696_00780 [Mycobacteroides franklinii]TDZ66320.1 hypothetical protein CCUG63695_00143 [Mycobacteroides franklinii]TDZ72243.1 hypothetical protein CCUG64056_00777 [Mycobacteroides franklinii]